MKYIAYGSNMVKAQMAFRCPGAKLIGTGYLPNHRLEFYLHATVERSRARDARVPVAVWEIDEADEQSLDRYEGFPTYYVKRKRRVILSDGSEIEGMVYIMRLIRLHPPTAGYYQGIRDAYKRMGLAAKNLSRTLEDSGTVLVPLIPWSSAGAYMAATLGVEVLQYLPYAVLCYSGIVMAIICACTGFGIAKLKPEEKN